MTAPKIVYRKVGSLPSCIRWYAFDANKPEQGPISNGHRTRREAVAAMERAA